MYPSPAEQYQPWVHVHTMRCLLTLVKSRQALRASRSLVKFTTMTAPFVQRSGKRRSRIPCLGHSHAMAVAWLSMPCMAFTRAYSLFALLLMWWSARPVQARPRVSPLLLTSCHHALFRSYEAGRTMQNVGLPSSGGGGACSTQWSESNVTTLKIDCERLLST